MRVIGLKSGLLALCAFAGSGLAALAQTSNADIKGNWTFESELDIACSFNGTAYIGEAFEGGLTCELTAHQACPIPGSDDEESWTVRQSCTVEREGDELVIRSTIKELLGGNVSDTYRPDNFYLEIKNKDLMDGFLVSYAAHPATWTRSEEPTS